MASLPSSNTDNTDNDPNLIPNNTINNDNKDNNNNQNKYKHTNALINEQSPYLLQHAHNPVNWMAWNDASLNKAHLENKLIFLSVGYSTCHWCHVMEHESFENMNIAKILNDNFICIKVDREERPDIDKIYMNYINALTQSGGWPMSVWLAPKTLNPIYGGTYYPKEQFTEILTKLANLWQTNKTELIQKSDYIINALKDSVIKKNNNSNISNVDDVFNKTYNTFTKRYDKVRGGFGDAPKFPRPVVIEFLFRYYYKNQDNDGGKYALKMCLNTLKNMGNGGIYDHLGGGFHRYSVDSFWHVPHFEKMLYDNSQLIISYLHAYQITREYFYKKIAIDTLNYILRDMKMEMNNNGGIGIYSAEDADSIDSDTNIRKEGAFYIWKEKEFDDILTIEESFILKELYFILQNGNCILSPRSDPHKDFIGKNVLFINCDNYNLNNILNKCKNNKNINDINDINDIEMLIKSGNKKLFKYRNSNRKRPHLDNKIICAWNGLILSSFCTAYKVLHLGFNDNTIGTVNYLKTAQGIATFLYDNMRDPTNGYLYRIYGKHDLYGFCVDYSFVINGLLDLYECSFNAKWLNWAIELQNIQNKLFFDDNIGGYFETVKDSPNVIMRLKEEYDGAEPCSSSYGVNNLLRLYHLTNNDIYYKKYITQTLQYLNNTFSKIPFAIPISCIGLDGFENGLKEIVISSVDNNNDNIGNILNDDEKDEQLKTKQITKFLNVIYGNYYPDIVCTVLNDNNIDEMKSVNQIYGYFGRDKNNNVMGHVCKNFSCQKPTNDHKQLEQQLQDKVPSNL